MANFNQEEAIKKANKIINLIGGKNELYNLGTSKRFLLSGEGFGFMFCARNTRGYNSIEIREKNNVYTVVLQKVSKFHKELQETISSLTEDQMKDIVSEATAYKPEIYYNPFWEELSTYKNEGRIVTTLS